MKQIQNFNPQDRFISLSVYKFPLGNCGGITDTLGRESIWMPCETGYMTFDRIENKELIFIPDQNVKGSDYWHLKPLMQPEGMVGPMAGGNLAYSSDSRVKHVYHIHDRFESQATYEAMSR